MATSKAVKPETPEVEIKEFGKYIVSHPLICHGKLTFRGTRILVSVVLEQLAEGLDWDTIVWSWDGKVPKGAIRDTILLARDALLISSNERRTAAEIGLSFSE